MKITVGEHQLNLNIRYSPRRRTIQLKIVSPEVLDILAPQNHPIDQILAVIHQKEGWLIKHLNHLKKLSQTPLNKSLNEGAEILFFGKPHRIQIHTSSLIDHIDLDEEDIHIYVKGQMSQEYVKTLLKNFYINSAKHLLTERTRYWSALIGVYPQRLRIKEQKTRWGSCSVTGTINYNWQIIMAPPSVIDYLVVHELAHMLIPNHSEKFWQVVSQYIPNHLIYRKWLKDHGMIMKALF